MALNDLKVKNLKPKGKPYKITDGDGLYLYISPAGGKLWRFKYRFDGKEKLLSFGKYPDITLLDARKRRDEARRLVVNGSDPGEANKKRIQKAKEEETFEFVAREWFGKFEHIWKETHSKRLRSSLERDVFPWIGNRLTNEIDAQELLAVIRRVETRGSLDTAHRVKILCGQIFRYAVATGKARRDPSGDLRGAIPPTQPGHMAAITDPVGVGALLRAIDCYDGSYIVQCALKLAPLLFVRPGELRHAEWAEIDFEKSEWSIAGKKMKMGEDHIVPLSRQAIEILIGLKQLTGCGRYWFPSLRGLDRPMSDNAILSALRRMGYEKHEMSGHGFRAMARTLLDEVLQERVDLIEHQLAHAVRDPLGRAYNRTKFLPQRHVMMQKWADYLDGLKGVKAG